MRELLERISEEEPRRLLLAEGIERRGRAAQELSTRGDRDWSLMEFYVGEALQLRADILKRGPGSGSKEVIEQRTALLTQAAAAYEEALPTLSTSNVVKAKECKEGLAGALVALAELRPRTKEARARLRQAKTLFKEVIEFAGRNMPDKHAGALANLAGMYDPSPTRPGGESPVSREEAVALLRQAECRAATTAPSTGTTADRNQVFVDTVLLKVASRCNLDCGYCYVYHMGDESWRAQPKRMSLATRKATADRLGELKSSQGRSFSIVLHGGEPLLLGSDGLEAMLSTLRETVGDSCGISIQTNGVLIDDRILDMSCPLSGGPSSMMEIARKGTFHAVEEAQARGDHREVA